MKTRSSRRLQMAGMSPSPGVGMKEKEKEKEKEKGKSNNKEKDAAYLAMRKRFQHLPKVHEAMETVRHYAGDEIHPAILKMHNQERLKLQMQLERHLKDVKERYERIRNETERKTNEKAELVRAQIVDKLNKLKTKLINQKKSNLHYSFKGIEDGNGKDKRGLKILLHRSQRIPDSEIENELAKIFDFESFNLVEPGAAHKRATRSTVKHTKKMVNDLHRFRFALDGSQIKHDLKEIIKQDRHNILTTSEKKVANIGPIRFGFLNVIHKPPNSKWMGNVTNRSHNHHATRSTNTSYNNNNNNSNSNGNTNTNNNNSNDIMTNDHNSDDISMTSQNDSTIVTSNNGMTNDNDCMNLNGNSKNNEIVNNGNNSKNNNENKTSNKPKSEIENENEDDNTSLNEINASNLYVSLAQQRGTVEYAAQQAINQFKQFIHPFDHTNSNLLSSNLLPHGMNNQNGNNGNIHHSSVNSGYHDSYHGSSYHNSSYHSSYHGNSVQSEQARQRELRHLARLNRKEKGKESDIDMKMKKVRIFTHHENDIISQNDGNDDSDNNNNNNKHNNNHNNNSMSNSYHSGSSRQGSYGIYSNEDEIDIINNNQNSGSNNIFFNNGRNGSVGASSVSSAGTTGTHHSKTKRKYHPKSKSKSKSKNFVEKYKVVFYNEKDAISKFGKNKNHNTPRSPNRDPNYNKENACTIDGKLYRTGQRVIIIDENNNKQRQRRGLLTSIKKTVLAVRFDSDKAKEWTTIYFKSFQTGDKTIQLE